MEIYLLLFELLIVTRLIKLYPVTGSQYNDTNGGTTLLADILDWVLQTASGNNVSYVCLSVGRSSRIKTRGSGNVY